MPNPRTWFPAAAALVLGLIIGVGLTGWEVLPEKDMAARATCADCHDLHGAIEIEEAPFQSQVWLLGDVPEHTYLLVNELFPYAQRERESHITLDGLLAQQGVADFTQVALQSLDGGFVILDRDYITEQSLLVPYLEGIRFKDENQHESTWLKGVRYLIVVSDETPIEIDGQPTSLGRMLLKHTATLVEPAGQAMFKSELDGQLYRATYTHLVMGAPIAKWLTDPAASITVETATGARQLDAAMARDALLTRMDGALTLVPPASIKNDWIRDVIAVRSTP